MQRHRFLAKLAVSAAILAAQTRLALSARRGGSRGSICPASTPSRRWSSTTARARRLYVGGSVDARCPVSKWDGMQWTGVGRWGSGGWAPDEEPVRAGRIRRRQRQADVVPRLAVRGRVSPGRRGVGASSRPPDVQCLAVFDDGSGPALYAGYDGGTRHLQVGRTNVVGGGRRRVRLGRLAGGERAVRLRRWRGPALYVTGHFSRAGGISGIAATTSPNGTGKAGRRWGWGSRVFWRTAMRWRFTIRPGRSPRDSTWEGTSRMRARSRRRRSALGRAGLVRAGLGAGVAARVLRLLL